MRVRPRMTETTARPVTLWLLSSVLAALFTAFQIQSSLHSGALSLPVTYDDVGYFNDALARLEVLYRDGGQSFLSGLWANPPHAPLETFLALAGFGLFGRHAWAADAMNALPLALGLRLVLGFAGRSLPLAAAAALAAAFLGFPLIGLFVLEFRPDMLCALLTSAGAIIVVAEPRWREGRRGTSLIVAGLFAGALLAKPTLAPVTVVVFGVAVLAVLGLQSKSWGDARRITRIAAMSGGLGALVVFPYYVAALPRLIEYITVNAFGSQANVWRQNLAWPEHALYYLTGPSGKAAIGRVWLAIACVLLILALPVVIRSRRTALGVLVVALTAYASVTVPSMKSPFLGLVVPALLLGIAVMLAVAALGVLPRHLSVVAALGLLTLSVATWRPVSLRLWNSSVPVTQAQQFTRIYEQTVDALASVPDLGRRRLYFPVIAQYLNPDNVEFELRRRGLSVPTNLAPLYFDANLTSHQAALGQCDLVVLFSDESTLPLPWPASTAIRKDIGAAVDSSGSFEPVATVDGGPYLGRVIVFKRKGS